jgi:hypothetical protein
MAAYNISEGGSDWQKLVVMDAANKKQTGDTLEIKFSVQAGRAMKDFIIALIKDRQMEMYFQQRTTIKSYTIIKQVHHKAPINWYMVTIIILFVICQDIQVKMKIGLSYKQQMKLMAMPYM